jgi:hypothetical protein
MITGVYLSDTEKSNTNRQIEPIAEELYEYDSREKKLLSKVIKFMKPARFNRIWERIFFQGQLVDR